MEGYVLHSYGDEKFLQHAVVSVSTLRRHDTTRPVALYCTDSHREILERSGLKDFFTLIRPLPEEHCSIIGFKHHLYKFCPWDQSLYVDSDMIWCRNPDHLWSQLSIYPYTATGLERADIYFGGPKNALVIIEFLRDCRHRTLKRFGLTHLPRVQAGMIYTADSDVTKSVCEQAIDYFSRRDFTHFRSRHQKESYIESCEWSIAMAMSRLGLPVFDWFQGANSPQLDYIPEVTEHTENFEEVSYQYYTDRFIHEIQGGGITNTRLRNFLTQMAASMLRRRDYMKVTPFTLHFGWTHSKPIFYDFVDRVWSDLIQSDKI